MSETAATYAVERTWDDIIGEIEAKRDELRHDLAEIERLLAVAHEQRDLEASYAT